MVKIVYYSRSGSIWWIHLLVIHGQEPLWTLFSFVVHIKQMFIIYIYELRSWARDCESEKRIEQNYFNGSAFTIICLRANHAGATVLHMPLSTYRILFDIDIWLMNHETKSVYFLAENWYSSLNCLNQPYWADPGPVFQKIQVIRFLYVRSPEEHILL